MITIHVQGLAYTFTSHKLARRFVQTHHEYDDIRVDHGTRTVYTGIASLY